MTLPEERLRALANTMEFLLSLLDPRQTPRVPTAVRREAGHCLRHFPSAHELERKSIVRNFHARGI